MNHGQWVIEHNGRRVFEVRLGARVTRIGADPSNDIVLDGPGMPPLAAVLTVDDAGRIWARRLEADPSDHEIEPGAAFELGGYILRREPAVRSADVQVTRRIEAQDPDLGPLRLFLPAGASEIAPGVAATLGRDEANDIVVDADVISGFHCRLSSVSGGWQVEDLGSTNGTFLDGVQVSTGRLPGRGTLVCGDLSIPFESTQSLGSADGFYGLVGQSSPMQAVFRQIEVVAALDEPVLIHGETGTGKELVAGALHAASPRRRKRFVARNCGAIPETLADAELFGSRRGAFSGAVDKAGVFEGAAGGTVFLDELGELPLSVQPKLLRAVQERKVQRLGDLAEKSVDFRLVAATHRDIRAMVSQQTFRADLFHRVGVFTIELPPLRDRPEDIPVLARHLLERSGAELTESAVSRLCEYPWPGNVRELRNALIRASAFRKGHRIDVEDLALESRPPPSRPAPKRRERKMTSLENDRVRLETLEVWEASGRSVSRAAARLGIAKSTMHRRKEIYGLPEPER